MATVICPACSEENPAKFRLCGFCGVPLAAAPPSVPAYEVRKTVTVLFSDLAGSTALTEKLDPEVTRDVMDRYFKAMSAEIDRHGGRVEKFIGDAIMAVFGFPKAREDDAIRAVRAADGMRIALAQVNADLERRYGVSLKNRTGINTGEVVANDDPTAAQKLATGDVVNVAARLEQRSGMNEILLGDTTYRLVHDAVEVEPIEPLELKGKSKPVIAHRLISARGLDGNVRRVDTPVVGRDEELATIEDVYRTVKATRVARLVTVIGDAGAGKSRLVHEIVERIAAGAVVLRGRCLSYGEGITFWPLRGLLFTAADIRDQDTPEEAQAKLLDFIGDTSIVDRLASALGLTAAPFPLQEVNWAARKFLERLAANGPVVALVDDIHWAEPAFLDLLRHVLDASVDVPLLLLTTTRHDLLEANPTWGEGPKALRVVLRPLSDEASGKVLLNLLGEIGLSQPVMARIVGAAEGNPLFVEQMLSMLIDDGTLRQEDGCWTQVDKNAEIAVPPTIHALIEARLDALGRPERAMVGPAAVIGLEFAQAALLSIAPEALRPSIDDHLSMLTRKRFIRPAAAMVAQSSVFRFQHQVMRDTVYNGLLKRSRATMHVDFVRWADRVNADRDRALEFEEILGYHLEQAYLFLSELGPLDAQGLEVARDAAGRLSRAGRRAFARGDMSAASNLYRRAIAALPEDDDERRALLPALGETLMGMGDFEGAHAVLDEALATADRSSDERIRASSQLVAMMVRLHGGEQQDDWGKAALRTAHEVIPVLERENAHEELATAWRLIVLAYGIAGQYTRASEAVERSTEHAKAAGNEHLVARNGLILSNNGLYGPEPVPTAIAQCEALLAEGVRFRQVEAKIMCILAQLKAMNGELNAARALYRDARAKLRDLGKGVFLASTGLAVARVELLGTELAAAEAEVRADYEFLLARGETYVRSTMAALLARIVRDQGRDDEALALSRAAEEAAAADDVESQVLWRAIRAPIIARAGDFAHAEELARGALELVRTSESPSLQAEALTELASVLNLAGKVDEAREAIAEATSLYVAKGDIVSARKAIDWSDQVGMFAPPKKKRKARASTTLKVPGAALGDPEGG